MKMFRRFLAAGALLLAPAASRAVNVPLPIEGASLNVQVTVQTQALITEAGTPDGQSASFDVFARRTRLLINGDINSHFNYYFQFDNANFGKFGNYTGRLIVQDAFMTWAPFSKTGGTVLLVDGGLTFVPFARGILTSISSQLTVEGHPDLYRGFNSAFFPANRSLGLQARGWFLDKKIGFRGGIFEGQRATAADPTINPVSSPLFSGFVNFNVIGTQEGQYLYHSIYFSKEPLLSISLSGVYQSKALKGPTGVTDWQGGTSTIFFEYPFSEERELIAIVAGYRYSNGSFSRDTGSGYALDVGWRERFVKPYVSWEYFQSDTCDPTLSGAPASQCAAQRDLADMRNFRAGLDFFINKTQNHVMVEFALNRGQSSWGPQSITAAAAGYAPLPGTGSLPFTSIGRSPSKSLLVHWSAYF